MSRFAGKTRNELSLMVPSDLGELEGRLNVSFGRHIRWNTTPLNLEQVWVAYKKTEAESQGKALKLCFSSIKALKLLFFDKGSQG
jgi:hypothetical protein